MFGMFGYSAAPIDKESCRALAAFNYLRMKREAALKAVNAHDDTQREAVSKAFDKKELALMRHIAGPLARIVDRK